jgi:hypothetical protein
VVLRGHQLAEWRKLDEVAEGERVEQADGGIAGRLVCKNKEAFGGKGGQLWLWSSGISTFTHSPVDVLRSGGPARQVHPGALSNARDGTGGPGAVRVCVGGAPPPRAAH